MSRAADDVDAAASIGADSLRAQLIGSLRGSLRGSRHIAAAARKSIVERRRGSERINANARAIVKIELQIQIQRRWPRHVKAVVQTLPIITRQKQSIKSAKQAKSAHKPGRLTVAARSQTAAAATAAAAAATAAAAAAAVWRARAFFALRTRLEHKRLRPAAVVVVSRRRRL